MRHFLVCAWGLCAATLLSPTLSASNLEPVSLRIEADQPGLSSKLIGRDARLQLIVSAELSSGDSRDWTHRALLTAEPGRDRAD